MSEFYLIKYNGKSDFIENNNYRFEIKEIMRILRISDEISLHKGAVSYIEILEERLEASEKKLEEVKEKIKLLGEKSHNLYRDISSIDLYLC